MVINSFTQTLCLIALLFWTAAISAVDVSIDRNSVRVNETFELTLNMESAPVDQPELIGLPGELEVLRSSNFYRKSIVNGQSSVQAGWTFTIKALNEGIFTIPSIEIEGKTTQPVTIRVTAAVSSAAINGQEDAIKIVSQINTNSIYVQQQLLYTIRLYRSVRAQYASLTEPELEGALIERLGDDIQYETNIDSVRYRVLERNYAIFPQQAGNFTISGVTYNAEVSAGRQSFGTLGSLRGRSRNVSLSSEDVNIEVKPIPKSITDWWLPATDVTISQSWKPETSSVEVGAPVTWTFTIVAEGLTSTQLPDVLPNVVDGLKFYPETAKSNNVIIDGKLVGKRTQTVAVIASAPGELTIPPIKVNWWDVTIDEAKTISLPERILTVTGEETVSQQLNDTPVETNEPISPVVSDSGEQTINTTDEVDNEQLLLWQIATALFVTLWLLTLIWRRQKHVPSTMATDSSQHQLNPSTQTTSSSLKSAMKSNDPAEISKALINTARTIIPSINSLADMRALIKDVKTIEELNELERFKYARSPSSDWKASQLSSQIDNLFKELKHLDKVSATEQLRLKPLHATNE